MHLSYGNACSLILLNLNQLTGLVTLHLIRDFLLRAITRC